MRIPNPFSREPDTTHTAYLPLVTQTDGHDDSCSDADLAKAGALLAVSELENQHGSAQESTSFNLGEVSLPETTKSKLQSALAFILSAAPSLLPACVTTLFAYAMRLLAHLTHRGGGAVDRPGREKPKPTAYLDGLRGVAALIVYIFHGVYLWFPGLNNGFGQDEENRYLFQLTILRTLHCGPASVAVFFVISGFVLTIGPLAKIHRRTKNNDVLAAMAGTSFRRPFRLFLPIVASTLINGVFIYNRLFIINGSGKILDSEPTIALQLADWWGNMVYLLDRFRHIKGRETIKGHRYDGHTWTIPVEMKGSLLVMMLLLIFAKAKRWLHAVGALGITYWLFISGDVDQPLFVVGMLLAELSIVAPPNTNAEEGDDCSLDEGASQRHVSLGSRRWVRLMRHLSALFLFFFSLHLLSFPGGESENAPGFRFLTTFAPTIYLDPTARAGPRVFWIAIGAALFILSLMYSPLTASSLLPKAFRRRLPWHQTSPCAEKEAAPPEPLFQRIFTTTFAQYLGRISYSLYLLHGLVNNTVGSSYQVPALKAWGKVKAAAETSAAAGDTAASVELLRSGSAAFQYEFACFMVVNTFVLFWASDIFDVLVDKPAVRLTRWLTTLAWKKED
ncbi:acyltransferase family-domain-containing protein [Plectosphaerella plurivora]|uniref:Acyltransferase family-domain-containing protein n=1 Tax=Plectosphaerella plurivora TaxID=936078 RepID=A0A9P8V649_9PEZI|nr:acyltransferase family-domain-containing protein [Plectosphaerella plurivora]